MSDVRRRFAELRRRTFLTAAGAVTLATLAVGIAPASWAQDSNTSIGVPGVLGGVVTTSEPAAARVGADILREGGNAVDAASAVMFALNVVEPQAAGIGGGGFMMIYLAKSGETVIIDSRERATAAADPEMFLKASDGEPFDFDISSTSGVSVGVPGAVLGVATALNNWGTISLSDALQPAIKLAEDGFRVSSELAEDILSPRLSNEPGDPAYEEARSVFRPGGVPLAEGDLLVQPDLAKTFKTIAEEGPDAFYTGAIAQAIVDTQRAARTVDDPADQAKLVGRMTLDDLAVYEVASREPVVDDYRGYQIHSMPSPSSGGLTMIQILKLIERFPIADEAQGYGFGSQRTLNVMIEGMRLAFADRAVWMGDDDFVPVPEKGLLDDDYIALRSSLIDPDARQDNVEAGNPLPFETAALDTKIKLAALAPPEEEGVHTTHFSVIDRDGNIVTYTNSIESVFGTGLMVQDYGFMLNNTLTDFNASPKFNPDPDNFDPGTNDVAAFKRPRSSMAPTIVFRNKMPLAAYGAPGGATIIDSVVNMTMNLIDHRRNVQEAVDAPRVAQTSANGTTRIELGFAEEVIDGLEELGHTFEDPEQIGAVQAIIVDQRGHRQYGAADKRRIGGLRSLRREELVE